MEVASALDYSKKVRSVPTYKLSRRAPTDQSSLAISPSGGLTRDWKLQSSQEYYNLSRSVLSFLMVPVAGSNYLNMFADCLSAIKTVELTSELDGNTITVVKDVNNFTKLVHYACTKYEDFMCKPVASSKLTTAVDMTSMLQRCAISNVAFSATNSGTTVISTNVTLVPSALTIVQTTIPSLLMPEHILRADNGSVQDWIRHPAELFLGLSASASPAVRVNVRLGETLKETLFSVDKVIPLPSCNLRITFSSSPEIVVNNTADGVVGGTYSAVTGNVTVSELYLFVCYNKDRAINDQLRAEVNSPNGLSVIFPVVRSDLRNLTISGAQNVNIALSYGPNDGQSLVRVYLVPFCGTKTAGSSNQIYVHTNLTAAVGSASDAAFGVRVSSFHTELNNNRIQDIDMDCTKCEDYLYIKPLLEDSIILTAKQYGLNWFWCDDWSSTGKLVESNLGEVLQGVPTAGGIDWSFVGIVNSVATIFTSCDFRIFSVFQKQMNISANGVLIR